MEYITYSSRGFAVSDFYLEKEFHDFVKHGGNKEYSTENIFHRIQLAIAANEIENNVCFIFEDNAYGIDECGHVVGCPKGFLNTISDINEKHLLAMMYKYQKKGK